MKNTIVFAMVLVALVAAAGALFFSSRSFNGPTSPSNDSFAQNDPIGTSNAGHGESVEQVIQKVIPKGPLAPEIASSTWLNSPALSTVDLRDHVVVVEFWTYG